MTQQESEPDLSVSVQESPVEAWVSGGLLQGLGALREAARPQDLLKEVAMNPEQTHHKLKNNYTKEILTLLRKF